VRQTAPALRSAIATAGERWSRRPGSWAAIPLGQRNSISGVLGVWSERPNALAPEGLVILRVIGPLIGVLFSHVLSAGRLRATAEHDPLTGLLNRRAFEARFEIERNRAERYGRPLALLIVDIDHFKAVNDTFGHSAGDAAIVAVAGCIRAGLRDVDSAARFGGEEFVALLPETGLAAARDVAERLRSAVSHLEPKPGGVPKPLRVSIGVSAAPECVNLASELLDSADRALYRAKAEGRDRVCGAGSVTAGHG
jgi:diguanylate cyclase (GGDEF)-like protein